MSITLPTLEDMLQAGVHFGHQVSRWHPKMKQYIYTSRSGVHILDLEETQKQLAEVLPIITKMAEQGKTILFVTTKPQARDIVRQAAVDCGMPYIVDRWLGGLLTNFPEIKKLIKKYLRLKEQQASGELERYTKKEQLEIAKELVKMDASLGGLTVLEAIPDVLFVPAFQREKTAVTEANKTGVEIIGVCDTNANPHKTTYVIPANDDAVKSIALIVALVRDAIIEGRKNMAEKETVVSVVPVVNAAPVIKE